jgi:hypothetical protein
LFVLGGCRAEMPRSGFSLPQGKLNPPQGKLDLPRGKLTVRERDIPSR